VSVTASDGLVRVRLHGTDALWAFKRRVAVPLGAVRGVRVADDLLPWLGWRHNELGLRLPGTMLPGVIASGSYWRRRSGWTLAALHRNQRALVVDVEPDGGRYRRLVLGVDDPDVALATIEAARPQA
jgi:hypothetical protein